MRCFPWIGLIHKPTMKHHILILGIITLLSSCGTYRYYQPTPHSALFQDEGEVHVAGDIGSSGASLKGAFSLPENIGIMASYNSAFFDYRSREGEIAFGYYTKARPAGIFAAGGLGFGTNYAFTDSTHTKKAYEGDFMKYFVQLNGGITGGKIIGPIRGDLLGVIKTSYFSYNGRHLEGDFSPINSDYLLIEPGMAMGLGTRAFRFDISVGFPWHPTLEGLDDFREARTFPATIGFGIHFILGRSKTY